MKRSTDFFKKAILGGSLLLLGGLSCKKDTSLLPDKSAVSPNSLMAVSGNGSNASAATVLLKEENGVYNFTVDGAYDLTFKITSEMITGTKRPANFETDTIKKSIYLLARVFSSNEFKDSLYAHSYNKESYSESKKTCFIKYPIAGNRVPGESVWRNVVSNNSLIALNLKIQNTSSADLQQKIMGFTSACSGTITSNDYWLNTSTARQYARHLAHEFTHVVGYRHSSLYKQNSAEDPAKGVGEIFANILDRWIATGKINVSNYTPDEYFAEPVPPIENSFGYGKEFQKIKYNPEIINGKLSADFSSLYTNAENELNAQSSRTLKNVELHFEANKVVFKIYYSNTKAVNFIANIEYSANVSSAGNTTFKFLKEDANSGVIVKTSSLFRTYFENNVFNLDWVKNTASGDVKLGGFYVVNKPTSFFYGQLTK